MQLADISTRTGISLPQLRYVLDNNLVSGTRQASGGRGTPREFLPGEAILIALAAAMFKARLQASFVRRFIALFNQEKSLVKLAVLPAEGKGYILEIDEQSHVRINTSDTPSTKTLPWFDLSTKEPLAANYRPLVYVTVDFGDLRRRLMTL